MSMVNVTNNPHNLPEKKLYQENLVLWPLDQADSYRKQHITEIICDGCERECLRNSYIYLFFINRPLKCSPAKNNFYLSSGKFVLTVYCM